MCLSAGFLCFRMRAPEGATLVSYLFSECNAHRFQYKRAAENHPQQMKERLWAYTAGICQHQGIFVHSIGGMEDHIHLLLQRAKSLTPKILNPSRLVGQLEKPAHRRPSYRVIGRSGDRDWIIAKIAEIAKESKLKDC